MHETFTSYINELPVLLKNLLAMVPVQPSNLPKDVPLKGIYLLSDSGKHLYVGRSNNIRRRINHHCRLSSKNNQATFAFRIAREKTEFKKATYKTNGSRKEIEENPSFKVAFITAKEGIRNMELRFIEVNDPIVQTLFEVYAAVVLNTPYNDFENH